MNKKIKVLIYTLLVFSLFAFAIYPKSHAKYIKEDESLFYGMNLYNLFIGDNNTISTQNTSTYETVKYKFNFDRSNYLTSNDESVSYRIVVNSDCNITRVETKGTKSFSNNTATIKYNKTDNNNGNYEDTIYVYYTCSVSDLLVTESNNEVVSTSFKVYETYKPDNIEYLYTKGANKLLLDEYLELYPLPTGTISSDKKTLTLPSVAEDKYDTFISWINQYAQKYGADYATAISSYVTNTYKNESDILNINLKLNGLNITTQNNNFIYTLDESFIGYARTYLSPNKYNVYFSDFSMTNSKVDELFEYYLNTYVFPGESTTIETIMNFIEERGSIGDVIKGNLIIPGLTYFNDKQYIKISDNILNIIAASKSSPAYALYGEMFDMFDSIAAGLTSNYSFITNEVIDYLNNTSSCFEFVDYWYTTGTAFNKYYVITPIINEVEQTPILFHIYSNYDANDSTTHVNYVTATQLTSGMEVVLESNDVSELKNAINSINTKLNIDKPVNDTMFTTSDTYSNYYTSVINGNNIKITFVLE